MPLRSPNTPRKPRILLVPPPELPVPAVQGGAVETLVTHLIRENERAGKLDLLCASIPNPEAAAQAQGLQHTKMLYVAKPRGVRRYYPMVFLERCFGVAAPYDPWYQKVASITVRKMTTHCCAVPMNTRTVHTASAAFLSLSAPATPPANGILSSKAPRRWKQREARDSTGNTWRLPVGSTVPVW